MSLKKAVNQVTHSGERLFSDYVELAKIEAQLRQRKMVRAGGGLSVAAVMGLFAWVLFVIACVALLSRAMALEWAALIMSAVHLSIAAVALAVARRPTPGTESSGENQGIVNRVGSSNTAEIRRVGS